jgi:DNA-3-methyladenine glycosylase II
VPARYVHLVHAIVHQQLATRAATAIFARLESACADGLSPGAIDALSDAQLAACGLSGAKRAAIRDLNAHVDAGTVRLERHGRLDDAAVMAELVAVRGVGPWTVHMYQMGPLGRPDIWPVGDFGVRQGWGLLHGLEAMITPRALAEAGAHLAPHRSAVAWYCWQAVHLERGSAR